MTLRGRSQPTEVWLAIAADAAQPPRPRDRRHPAGQPRPGSWTCWSRRCDRADRRPHPAGGHGARATPASARAGWCASCTSTPAAHRAAPVLWYTGRCPPFGENVTYAALADIVKAHAVDPGQRLRAGRPGAAGRPRCTDLVGPAEAARLSDALGPLVGLPGFEAGRRRRPSRPGGASSARWPPGSRPCWSSRTCTGPTSRCCASSSCSGRRCATCRCCCSPPPGRSWWSATRLDRHGLRRADDHAAAAARPRDRDDVRAPARARRRTPPEALEPLVELADGNPLYAHEYTRMLIEQGALRPTVDAGRRRPAADAGQRARGHRQPGRPARRRRPRGAAGRRRRRHAVLAGRGRRRAEPRRSTRSSARCAGWNSATSCTSSAARRWTASSSTGSATCWSATSATSGCRAPSGSPGTSAPPTGWTGSPPSRATDLAEVLAHHRYTAYEIARTLGADAAPLRARRPGRAAPGRPARVRAAGAGHRRHARRAGPPAVRRRDPTGRPAADRAARGRDRVLRDDAEFLIGRRRRPAHRPRRAARTRPASRAARPGPGRCSARPRGCAPTGSAALSCLDRAVELFDDLPDTPREGRRLRGAGPAAHAQLRGRARPIAAAGAAAEIASRLGLVEVRGQRPDHHRHRPLHGRRPGRAGRAAGRR